MSKLDLTDSHTGVARGSGKPQAGEPVAHPGRGGQNLFINDRPVVNHPRGSGTHEQVESGSLNNARGGGKSQEGEAVSHPGRGGQNMYINDMPSPNHPRGSGASQGATPAQSTQEPQSLNDSGLTKLQMTLIAERMNEVMQNNVLQNQPSMES